MKTESQVHANGSERENLRIVADSSVPVDNTMRLESHAITELDIIADNRIGSDKTILTQLSFWTYNGRRVNVSGMRSSRH